MHGTGRVNLHLSFVFNRNICKILSLNRYLLSKKVTITRSKNPSSKNSYHIKKQSSDLDCKPLSGFYVTALYLFMVPFYGVYKNQKFLLSVFASFMSYFMKKGFPLLNERLCVIWCYLYNLKNLKNNHGGVLILKSNLICSSFLKYIISQKFYHSHLKFNRKKYRMKLTLSFFEILLTSQNFNSGINSFNY